MPVAVLIGGLIAIAFAFAAIAAALVMENLVISPLKGAAAAASEIALVGGAISWLLWHLIDLIRFSLAGVQALVGDAENQAASWWNYLVYNTVQDIYSYWWAQVVWLTAQEGWISWLETYMPPLRSYVLDFLAPAIATFGSGLVKVTAYVQATLIPWVNAIQNQINYVQALVTGYLIPRVASIGDDLAGLRQWVDQNVVVRGELAQAEAATLARVQALVVPVEAAIADIQNLPCIKTCEPLGNIGQLIQGLEDAGLLAIMLGLVSECLHDPEGVQRVLRSTVVPIVDGAASDLGFGG